MTALERTFENLRNDAENKDVTSDCLRQRLAEIWFDYKYYVRPYKMQFSRLFRSRAIDALSAEDASLILSNVNELTSPRRPEHCRENRCNRQGKSVFYASSDSGVAVFEVRPKVGQYVARTSFNPIYSKLYLTTPIVGIDSLYHSLLNRSPLPEIVPIIEMEVHDMRRNSSNKLLIDHLISDWFTSEVDDNNKYIYRLCNALYEVFLNNTDYKGVQTKSLIYPSVGSAMTGYNIVLDNEIADNKLRMYSSELFLVEHKTASDYHLRKMKEVNYVKKNGDIRWRNSDDQSHVYVMGPDTPTHIFRW